MPAVPAVVLCVLAATLAVAAPPASARPDPPPPRQGAVMTLAFSARYGQLQWPTYAGRMRLRINADDSVVGGLDENGFTHAVAGTMHPDDIRVSFPVAPNLFVVAAGRRDASGTWRGTFTGPTGGTGSFTARPVSLDRPVRSTYELATTVGTGQAGPLSAVVTLLVTPTGGLAGSTVQLLDGTGRPSGAPLAVQPAARVLDGADPGGQVRVLARFGGNLPGDRVVMLRATGVIGQRLSGSVSAMWLGRPGAPLPPAADGTFEGTGSVDGTGSVEGTGGPDGSAASGAAVVTSPFLTQSTLGPFGDLTAAATLTIVS